MARLTEYQHDGHPDVAAQYPQGTFTIGETDEYADSFVARAWRELAAEVPEGLRTKLADSGRAETVHATAEMDITRHEDNFVEVTLSVLYLCDEEDHNSVACECREYVHVFGWHA